MLKFAAAGFVALVSSLALANPPAENSPKMDPHLGDPAPASPELVWHCFEPIADTGIQVDIKKLGRKFSAQLFEVDFAGKTELLNLERVRTKKLDGSQLKDSQPKGFLPKESYGALDLNTGNSLFLSLNEGNGSGENIKWTAELNAFVSGVSYRKDKLDCVRL